MSRSISYGLAVAGGWNYVKLGKLLHVLGKCLNNEKFYFGNKINVIFGYVSLYSFIYINF
jgi:hypothetical protein